VKNHIIGFLDESAIQLNPSKRRVINTSIVKYKEGKKRSKSIFGFIALNGNDVVMLSDSCKSDDMIDFLEVVRRQNPERPLCIVLDNARIHHAKIVRARAEELDIYFIYLPPYSPDLNPIEFGWKDLKRELSSILDFDEMIEGSELKALELFSERKQSYSRYWVDDFISIRCC
jgi:transposase